MTANEWYLKLKDKEAHEAYRLVYDLTKPLNMEQRNRLWQYWKKINDKPLTELDSEWWNV